MKWSFATNQGGQEYGIHDAGVATFQGNHDRYLARELIQNSLDARLDPNKPVHVSFQVVELDRESIPDIQGLSATFQRCAEYWTGIKKAVDFFIRAENISSSPKITALRVGDYNTSGVEGSDRDRAKNWYHLIRCAGSSAKASDEGGSFGIGKNAPFAASQLRTVLYSTLNKHQEAIFQGVARLVSHTLPSGATAQPTGYLGDADGISVRAPRDIPIQFLRRELGTDIIVLGFPAVSTWQEDLVYSVLENFWPAIDFGDLEVTVGEEKITRDTLGSLLEKFSGKEDFAAHLYYQAFKNPTATVQQSLATLGSVSLYLSSANTELPKRVAMVRKTGMIIFHKQFRSIIQFCGVFVCRNEKGNHLLREMEPPSLKSGTPIIPKRVRTRKLKLNTSCLFGMP